MFQKRTVVCFGAGMYLDSYIARLQQGIKVKYVCDNDSRKWNKRFSNEKLLCISPDYLTTLDNPLVVITVDDANSVMQLKNQLNNLRVEYYHARDVLNWLDYTPDNTWLSTLNCNKIHTFIDLDIRGTNMCNFHCEYCVAWRRNGFGESRIISEHSVQEIRKGISQEKLGGPSFINICARGETFLAENIVELIYELLEEGHYVSIVTNGTITNNIKRITEFSLEFQERMFFKLSFHYLELQKRKLFDLFWSNVERIRNSRCSYTLEITPCDGLVEYIPNVKQMFDEKADGAMPHISFARDSTKKGLDVLSEYPLDKYRKLWGQFESKMFDLKSRNYGEKITQYCYAGAWSYLVNALTGEIRNCYRQEPIGNIFDSELKIFPKRPVGHNCCLDYCFNNHAFMAWGDIPEKKEATYLEMRDRTGKSGQHWVKEPMYSFMNDKLYETNFMFGDFWEDYEKLFDSKRKPALLIFNSPDYYNIGDMAIAVGERKFLNKFFPQYEVIEISCKQYELENKVIKKAIMPEDIIFITGGGNIGSFWLNIEDYVTGIITDFKDNKIFIFPQTLYFEENNVGEKEKDYLKKVINEHNKVFVTTREKFSYETAKNILGKENYVECVPDMALFMPVVKSVRMRIGALICIRRDKESLEWKYDLIEAQLNFYTDNVEYIDRLPVENTSLLHREEEVKNIYDMLCSKEIVVTDRLHCMILCALTGTPCVALDNISGKVEGVYQWISDLPYIKFAETIEDVGYLIDKVVKADAMSYSETFDILQSKFEIYAEKIKNEL